MPRRSTTLLPLALTFPLTLFGCVSGPHLGNRAEYVAMGSSFAAGAAIGPLQHGSPQRCGRTANNYASLLAERMDLALKDQSCGGAHTDHVLGPWSELPAQIDAVTASTRLVTVTVGGNDLNYVGNLFMASCGESGRFRVGEYEITCSPPKVPDEAAFERVESRLMQIAQEVKRRAPDARLIFIQYVSLVPDEPCNAANLSEADAEVTQLIGKRLAEITARVARDSGTELLEADLLSREHSPCSATPWTNGSLINQGPSKGQPWHPNATGHRVIADALASVLGARK